MSYQLSNPKEIAAKHIAEIRLCLSVYVPYLDPIARGQSFIGTSGEILTTMKKRFTLCS